MADRSGQIAILGGACWICKGTEKLQIWSKPDAPYLIGYAKYRRILDVPQDYGLVCTDCVRSIRDATKVIERIFPTQTVKPLTSW